MPAKEDEDLETVQESFFHNPLYKGTIEAIFKVVNARLGMPTLNVFDGKSGNPWQSQFKPGEVLTAAGARMRMSRLKGYFEDGRKARLTDSRVNHMSNWKKVKIEKGEEIPLPEEGVEVLPNIKRRRRIAGVGAVAGKASRKSVNKTRKETDEEERSNGSEELTAGPLRRSKRSKAAVRQKSYVESESGSEGDLSANEEPKNSASENGEQDEEEEEGSEEEKHERVQRTRSATRAESVKLKPKPKGKGVKGRKRAVTAQPQPSKRKASGNMTDVENVGGKRAKKTAMAESQGEFGGSDEEDQLEEEEYQTRTVASPSRGKSVGRSISEKRVLSRLKKKPVAPKAVRRRAETVKRGKAAPVAKAKYVQRISSVDVADDEVSIVESEDDDEPQPKRNSRAADNFRLVDSDEEMQEEGEEKETKKWKKVLHLGSELPQDGGEKEMAGETEELVPEFCPNAEEDLDFGLPPSGDVRQDLSEDMEFEQEVFDPMDADELLRSSPFKNQGNEEQTPAKDGAASNQVTHTDKVTEKEDIEVGRSGDNILEWERPEGKKSGEGEASTSGEGEASSMDVHDGEEGDVESPPINAPAPKVRLNELFRSSRSNTNGDHLLKDGATTTPVTRTDKGREGKTSGEVEASSMDVDEGKEGDVGSPPSNARRQTVPVVGEAIGLAAQAKEKDSGEEEETEGQVMVVCEKIGEAMRDREGQDRVEGKAAVEEKEVQAEERGVAVGEKEREKGTGNVSMDENTNPEEPRTLSRPSSLAPSQQAAGDVDFEMAEVEDNAKTNTSVAVVDPIQPRTEIDEEEEEAVLGTLIEAERSVSPEPVAPKNDAMPSPIAPSQATEEEMERMRDVRDVMDAAEAQPSLDQVMNAGFSMNQEMQDEVERGSRARIIRRSQKSLRGEVSEEERGLVLPPRPSPPPAPSSPSGSAAPLINDTAGTARKLVWGEKYITATPTTNKVLHINSAKTGFVVESTVDGVVKVYEEGQLNNAKEVAQYIGRNMPVFAKGYLKEEIKAFRTVEDFQSEDWDLDAYVIYHNFRLQNDPNCKVSSKPQRLMNAREYFQGYIDGADFGLLLDGIKWRKTVPNKFLPLDDAAAAYQSTKNLYLEAPEADDIPSLRLWDLVHHRDKSTNCHEDAAGLGTLVWSKDGSKVWVMFRPKKGKARNTILEQLYIRMSNVVRSDFQEDRDAQFFKDNFDIMIFVVRPGDCLFMPPGMWHAVYTEDVAYFRGSHFYTYNSLHLTEASRRHQKDHDEETTNIEHPSALDHLVRMVVKLSQREEEIPRRSLLALLVMVYFPEEYVNVTEKNRIKGIMNYLDSDVNKYLVDNVWITRQFEFARRVCKRLFRSVFGFAVGPRFRYKMVTDMLDDAKLWDDEGQLVKTYEHVQKDWVIEKKKWENDNLYTVPERERKDNTRNKKKD